MTLTDSYKFWEWVENSFKDFIEYFSGLYVYYTTDMYTVLKNSPSELISSLIDILPEGTLDFFKNTSIFSLMLGSGITIYVVVVVVKFLVSLFLPS